MCLLINLVYYLSLKLIAVHPFVSTLAANKLRMVNFIKCHSMGPKNIWALTRRGQRSH